MYITPNSDVRLLSGCPIDKSYNHTIYFSSATEQADYFLTLTKPTYGLFSKVSYQRAGKNTIRLQVLADNIYDCNYLMFRNTAYGTKWFYAFINRIEYINDNVTEIEYTIDVMQTWYFDYELGECFVEREHSLSDHVGENTIPENLELNELTVSEIVLDIDLTPDVAIFWTKVPFQYKLDDVHGDYNFVRVAGASPDLSYDPDAHLEVSKDVERPCMFAFSLETEGDIPVQNLYGTAALKKFLSVVTADDIITAYLHSSMAFPSGQLPSGQTPYYQLFTVNVKQTLDGYTPKNKKLLTFPYNLLYLTNLSGQTAELRLERFTTSVYNFRLYYDCFYNPSFMLAPMSYQIYYPTGEEKINPEYCVTVKDFPSMPVITDALTAWLEKNQASVATNTVTSALTGGLAILGATSPIGGAMAATSLVGKVGNTMARMLDLALSPGSVYNNASNDTLRAIASTFRIQIQRKTVTREYAQMIDDYFSMFGYASHRVKYPYIRQYSKDSLRPHWNFIKTQGCIIHSSRTLGKGIPAEAEAQISKIYDNGITFWMDGNEVGDYSLDNSPPTPKNGG